MLSPELSDQIEPDQPIGTNSLIPSELTADPAWRQRFSDSARLEEKDRFDQEVYKLIEQRLEKERLAAVVNASVPVIAIVLFCISIVLVITNLHYTPVDSEWLKRALTEVLSKWLGINEG
jgi:hypothetical protein